jgi:hypothetical protein
VEEVEKVEQVEEVEKVEQVKQVEEVEPVEDGVVARLVEELVCDTVEGSKAGVGAVEALVEDMVEEAVGKDKVEDGSTSVGPGEGGTLEGPPEQKSEGFKSESSPLEPVKNHIEEVGVSVNNEPSVDLMEDSNNEVDASEASGECSKPEASEKPTEPSGSQDEKPEDPLESPKEKPAEASKPGPGHSRSNSRGKKGKGDKNSPKKKKLNS